MERWERFSVAVALASVVAAAMVVLVDESTGTRWLALGVGVAAMVVLDWNPISFRRNRSGRLYTTVVEIGFAFVATWSTPRVVVLAVALGVIPMLFDASLQLWKRALSSSTTLLAASVGAVVLGLGTQSSPSLAWSVIAAAATMSLTSTALTTLADRVVHEARDVSRPATELLVSVLIGAGCGVLGWATAVPLTEAAPGPAVAAVALGVVVALCTIISRGAEESDRLASTVRALSELGVVDDPDRLRMHLALHAPGLVRGATRLALVEDGSCDGEAVPVPRHPGMLLLAERHEAADPLVDSERDRLHMVAALVADSLERADRLADARMAASTDPLTKTLNRRGLTSVLEALSASGAVAVLDIDKLKAINDASGHDAGDMAVVAIATRLRERLRASDHIARTGGDEFVVVMPNTSVSEATAVMGAALSSPIDIQLKDQTRPVTVSWGIAAFENTQDDSIRAATKAADVALYEAKRSR